MYYLPMLLHIVPLVYTGVHSLDCPSPPVHAVQLRLCVERVALRCVNGVHGIDCWHDRNGQYDDTYALVEDDE